MNQLIKVYKSSVTNGPIKNLGGPPLVALQDNEYITGFFNWDSVHPTDIYSIFYAKNDTYSTAASTLSVALQVRIDYDANIDVIKESYLRALSVDIFRPNYAEIGYVHPPITVEGFFVDAYPKQIVDFVQEEEFGRKILFIDNVLQPGQFFPFIIRLSLNEPIGTVFKQPIKINVYTGVF